jgi:KUP system potassium uptake protein
VDLPAALRQACADDLIGPGIDVEGASYFLSRGTISLGPEKVMATWRKRLFTQLARHAADPAEYFGLPRQRIVTMGSHVTL